MGRLRLFALRAALVVFGLFFIFGLYPMMNWWAVESWGWLPRQPEYEQMIMGIYATLGLFLLLAIKKPQEHRSLLLFTVWSSVVHASIMLAQALSDKSEQANLMGDIPALFAVALIIGLLLPNKAQPKNLST